MAGHFFFDDGFCDKALPAADLDFLFVRPSRRTFDAALAAFVDVTFCVLRCDSALPAADFEALPTPPEVRVFEAFDAALPDVILPAILLSLLLGKFCGPPTTEKYPRPHACTRFVAPSSWWRQQFSL